MMTSCERVMYYGQKVPPEETPADRAALEPPPAGWLARGGGEAGAGAEIVFEKVGLRYRTDLPLVLRSVSWSAPRGSKVGIVGRTGSGKSSLIMALTRLYNMEGDGAIKLDGVDARAVSLASLRNGVALIQQEPHLFAGTVRQRPTPS
jgi:ABC-type multidrug transport system fused ATPase/permease subunit